MNWAHVHLLLNHIPGLGTVFGLLLLSVALVRQSGALKKVSLAVFAIIAVMALPVYFTGEPAEEVVEHLPGVSGSMIEHHEEAALISLAAVEILGIIALVGLVLSRRSPDVPKWCSTTILILAVVAGGLMAWTANRGGQIRHTEIRAASGSSALME